MEITTSMGSYRINYYWDSAEFEDNKQRTGVSLKWSGTEVFFIRCSPLEKEEVLFKLSDNK